MTGCYRVSLERAFRVPLEEGGSMSAARPISKASDLDPSPKRAESGRLEGEMIWFNNEKDSGFIATGTGERLSVDGSAFSGGKRPQGRCGGRVVSFRVTGEGEAAKAEDVAFVEDAAPRRARRRGRG